MRINRLILAQRVGLYVSIILVAVVTYLPAVDNFFISDDFTMLSYLEALKQNPLTILNDSSELFRVVSYVYFWLCSVVFGLNSTGYYWASIGLHVLTSLLVCALILKITGQHLAGWAGGLFFAAYERHQEAVMWISAVNDTILTVLCVVFLLLWLQTARFARPLAFVVFGLALFSKEPAVTLLPLAVLLLVMRGSSWREALVKSAPLAFMTAAYVGFWLSRANSNFFVTDQHYALGFHFVPVFVRTVVRMAVPPLLFMLPLFVFARKGMRNLLRDQKLLLFAALLCLAVIPYSFLTYLPSIPSRNTYWPSVGLAAMVGLAFASLFPTLLSRRARGFAVALFVVLVNQNIAYVWIKKEPQYIERAAPTRQLIDSLNGLDGELASDASICVVGFPLHPWIGTESVKWFTRFDKNRMTFSKGMCDPKDSDIVVRWDTNNVLTAEYPRIATAP